MLGSNARIVEARGNGMRWMHLPVPVDVVEQPGTFQRLNLVHQVGKVGIHKDMTLQHVVLAREAKKQHPIGQNVQMIVPQGRNTEGAILHDAFFGAEPEIEII